MVVEGPLRESTCAPDGSVPKGLADPTPEMRFGSSFYTPTEGVIGDENSSCWLRSRVLRPSPTTTSVSVDERNRAVAISRRHHEIPQWLLREFSFDGGQTLWMGFVDSGEAKPVPIKAAFVRKGANARTDYARQSDGSRTPVKSDRDEVLLAQFDGAASVAARDLIAFARQHREAGPVTSAPGQRTLETCKRIIVAQARRTRESQDRMGFGDDKSELLLEVSAKRAAALGESVPLGVDLLEDPRFTEFSKIISQNHRATFAGGRDPRDLAKEAELLAPLGLDVAVVDSPGAEFVIGSHGTTIVPTQGGGTSWLPLAPDVAISFSDRRSEIGVGICYDDFVDRHNHAACDSSARIGGRTEGTIRRLLKPPSTR